jgi:hypothetical protein
MEKPAYREVMGDGRRCAVQADGECVPEDDPPAGWPFIWRFVPWIVGGMLVVLVALLLARAVSQGILR